MSKFTVEYTATEITLRRVLIEAETAEEAVEAVRSYEFDNSDDWFCDSYEWSIGDVKLVETAQ